jgi:hypothetical protein
MPGCSYDEFAVEHSHKVFRVSTENSFVAIVIFLLTTEDLADRDVREKGVVE